MTRSMLLILVIWFVKSSVVRSAQLKFSGARDGISKEGW